MFNMNDGPRMVMDGTYVNAPDVHDPQRKIGLREFNNGVLVHNWFESRADVKKYSLRNYLFIADKNKIYF